MCNKKDWFLLDSFRGFTEKAIHHSYMVLAKILFFKA